MLKTLLGAAILSSLAFTCSSAFANQTGNESNIPAVIQRPILQGAVEVQPQRHAGMPERTIAPRKVCRFNGDESGDRNPDYVHCFE